MPKPVAEWNEDYVLSLPLEDDTLERKGAPLLDLTLPGVDENRVRSELAKQLSAFANTGGGRIIYGVSNNGTTVDQGGVSRIIRGRQSAKEWLENVIPTSTEYEILGVNVLEVLSKKEGSAIADGKAIYVVDVPDSERAPHQSKTDLLYYIRLGTKSRPAPHKIIEDIRNRARHPNLTFTSVELVDLFLPRENLPRILGPMRCRIQVNINNSGMLKASNACIQIEAEHAAAWFDSFDNTVVKPRLVAKRNIIFWEIQDPIYPGMEINFWFDLMLPVELLEPVPSVRAAIWLVPPDRPLREMKIGCRLFADNAPVKLRSLSGGELGFCEKARDKINHDAAGAEIQRHYGLS